jgi:hypothetical protein
VKALLEKVSCFLLEQVFGLRAGELPSALMQPPWPLSLFGVTLYGSLTHSCPLTPLGTCRAHLSGSPSPGRGRCHLFGAGKEGEDRETGMEQHLSAQTLPQLSPSTLSLSPEMQLSRLVLPVS